MVVRFPCFGCCEWRCHEHCLQATPGMAGLVPDHLSRVNRTSSFVLQKGLAFSL